MAARKTQNKTSKRTKNKIKRFSPVTVIFVFLILVLAAGFGYSAYLELHGDRAAGAYAETPGTVYSTGADLAVYYLDVGQGDSELIVAGNTAMLIDAGEAEYGESVVSYIKKLGITKLDYIIATHPHSDHIGGLPAVIESFDVGKIIAPKLPDSQTPTSKVYEKFLDAVSDKGLKITAAKAGDIYSLGGNKNNETCAFTVLSPGAKTDYSDLNNYSVVIKLVYGKSKWLFTGDAEKQAETKMLESKFDLSADVLKVGHHGGSTSTTDEFLDSIKPQAAVIEVGAGNSYGHPSEAVLERLSAYTDRVYRTDLEGTIIFKYNHSDGKIIHVNN
jgi:competence protein ComEC